MSETKDNGSAYAAKAAQNIVQRIGELAVGDQKRADGVMAEAFLKAYRAGQADPKSAGGSK